MKLYQETIIKLFFSCRPRLVKLIREKNIFIRQDENGLGFSLLCPNCGLWSGLYYCYSLLKFSCSNKPNCNLSILLSLKGLARLETKYKTHFAKKKKQLLEKINRQLSVVNQAQKNLKKARVQVNRNSYISPQELNKVLSNKLPNAVNTLPESKANINPPLLTNVKPVSTLSQPVKPSEACEFYADYALHGKIGIHCENPLMRGSFDPSETITWQIEGEALAIKMGVEWFLKTRLKKQRNLIIYTDNKTLIAPLQSETRAGELWGDAWQLAISEKVKLEIRWINGKDNPADALTRDSRPVLSPQKQKKHFFEQYLTEQGITKSEFRQCKQRGEDVEIYAASKRLYSVKKYAK